MTTFTLQDLTLQPQQENSMTPTELILDHINAPEVPRETKEVLHNLLESRGTPNPNAIQYTHGGTLGAPEPQPSAENLHNIGDIINTICTQLQLLATVISQSQAETKAGENSLQECVSTTLQQADWFKDLIRVELVALDLEKIAESAVESIVENEVESYFENRFDPSDHFDFGDAVSDCVSDQIDDVVSDKIDDAVDAYLSNATISISK
jgi:hypothetical protein